MQYEKVNYFFAYLRTKPRPARPAQRRIIAESSGTAVVLSVVIVNVQTPFGAHAS